MELKNVWQKEVDPKEVHEPVHLDMEYYSKLWTENDMWRLMTAAYNLNIHIDYLYDHIIRFMRNALEKFPDGYIGPASTGFITDMAGWGLQQVRPFQDKAMDSGEYFTWYEMPHDGFIQYSAPDERVKERILSDYPELRSFAERPYYPNGPHKLVWYEPGETMIDAATIFHTKAHSCMAIRDPEKWKYYIEHSDPEIGQGKWGDVMIKTGPQPAPLRGEKQEAMSEEMQEYLHKYTKIPEILGEMQKQFGYGELPKKVYDILYYGIGDKDWLEILKEMKSESETV